MRKREPFIVTIDNDLRDAFIPFDDGKCTIFCFLWVKGEINEREKYNRAKERQIYTLFT